MSTVWFSLKKSLHCKSDSSDVHDPKSKTHLPTILTRKPGRWGCSRSIANLKDVVINGGSKRHNNIDKNHHVNCSPRSIGSSEFLNPITHEVVLNNSRCELKITSFGGGFHEVAGAGDEPAFVGTLSPGTPRPGGNQGMQYCKSTPPRRIMGIGDGNNNVGLQKSRRSSEKISDGSTGGGVTCHKCCKQFKNWEDLETHYSSKHAGKVSLVFSFFKNYLFLSIFVF